MKDDDVNQLNLIEAITSVGGVVILHLICHTVMLRQANKTGRSDQQWPHTQVKKNNLTTFISSTRFMGYTVAGSRCLRVINYGVRSSPTTIDTFPSRRSRATCALSGISTRVTAQQLHQSAHREPPLFVTSRRPAPHAYVSAKEKHKLGNSHRPVTRPTAEQLSQPDQGV